jgi:hypothetical protein
LPRIIAAACAAVVVIGAAAAAESRPAAKHLPSPRLAAPLDPDLVGVAHGASDARVVGVSTAAAGGDVLVNDPSRPGDAPGCTVQSEASVAAYRQHVWVGFNDGEGCVSEETDAAHLHFTGFARSTDGGRHFVDRGPLIPNGTVTALTGDPVLAVDRTGRDSGTVYLASLATNASGQSTIAVGTSTNYGTSFAWHDAAPAAAAQGGTQDKEWIAVDNSGGRQDGTVYLTWTDFANSGTTSIKEVSSADHGLTWSPPRTIVSGSVQGSQPAVGPNGQLYVVWEQGFGTIGFPANGPISIWWSESADGGLSFTAPTQVGSEPESGAVAVCGSSLVRNVVNGSIRINEFPSIAVDTYGSADRRARGYNPYRGTVYVVFSGAGAGNDESDVYLSRLAPGSRTWSSPRRLNDDQTTTDQFFPEVTVPRAGEVAAYWTDRRQDAALPAPAGDRLMDQWMVVGSHGGTRFGRNAQLSSALYPPPVTAPNLDVGVAWCYAGDYNGLYSDGDGTVYAAWGDNRDSLRVQGQYDTRTVPDPNVYFRRQAVPS